MNRNLLVLLLFGAVTSSQAVTTGVQQSNAPPGSATVRAPIKAEAAKAMADDSSGLRKGTIEAVNIPDGTFQVFGETLTFDAAKVRIFGKNGKATSVHALKRGATVRFSLDPDDSTRRRVAVVYLD